MPGPENLCPPEPGYDETAAAEHEAEMQCHDHRDNCGLICPDPNPKEFCSTKKCFEGCPFRDHILAVEAEARRYDEQRARAGKSALIEQTATVIYQRDENEI